MFLCLDLLTICTCIICVIPRLSSLSAFLLWLFPFIDLFFVYSTFVWIDNIFPSFSFVFQLIFGVLAKENLKCIMQSDLFIFPWWFLISPIRIWLYWACSGFLDMLTKYILFLWINFPPKYYIMGPGRRKWLRTTWPIRHVVPGIWVKECYTKTKCHKVSSPGSSL